MGKQKKNRNAAFFQARADELNQLCQCLENLFAGDYYDLSSLKNAAKVLETEAKGIETLDEWGYKIENLILPVGEIRNTEPSGIAVRICVGCECRAKVADFNKYSDPFMVNTFHLHVFGDYQGMKYSWGMHLEKDTSNESTEWHPLYHLHCFDGHAEMKHALKDTEQNRGMLYLNVPRLVHYPLDIILGISFFLMNFHKKDVFLNLFKNSLVFSRLYMGAQKRIIEPYFDAIANTRGAGTGWADKKELCPQIVQ